MERVGAKSREFTINGTIKFGNSAPIAWEQLDRCTYHLDNTSPTLPDYTLYTLVPLKVYFLIFIAIHLLQSFSIFILKSKIANAFSEFNFLEKMIHCLESTNLPYNVQEWDTPMGNAQDHIKRMKANRMEGLVLIALNLIFKFIMLIPIFVLGYNMKQRHQVLTTSIGAHPEEQEAMETIVLLLKISTSYITIATLLEAIFFVLYNGPCHPFSKILDTSTDEGEQERSCYDRVIEAWNYCHGKCTNNEQQSEAIELSEIVHANQQNIRLEEAGPLCPSGSETPEEDEDIVLVHKNYSTATKISN